MCEPIEDGVDQSGITEVVVPMLYFQMAGDVCALAVMTVIKEFRKSRLLVSVKACMPQLIPIDDTFSFQQLMSIFDIGT